MTVVQFNEAAVARLLSDPAGAVGRDLTRRAINVRDQAVRNASGRPGPNVQTGRLRSSITFDVLVKEGQLVARVGTNVEYALFVEEGTSPHDIRPRRRRALSWPTADHPVRLVHHPGNRPYPFLRPALSAAAL